MMSNFSRLPHRHLLIPTEIRFAAKYKNYRPHILSLVDNVSEWSVDNWVIVIPHGVRIAKWVSLIVIRYTAAEPFPYPA
jgi:hypothetical protein